ncbi:MAG: DEAD/DEAH box helicase [Nitrososphaerales archaeon]
MRPASYQLVPLTKLLTNGSNMVLVCDGVGVGKTISAGLVLSRTFGLTKKRAFVICSPTLIDKWRIELGSKFGFYTTPIFSDEEFKTMESEMYHSPTTRLPSAYVIPYSLFQKFRFKRDVRASTIVFDEIHTFRNPETRWFESAKYFSSMADFRIGLTATPINNGLMDLVAEFSILMPDSSFEAIQTSIEELWSVEKNRIINPFMTRFTKERLGLHFARRSIKSIGIRYPSEYNQKVMSLLQWRSRRGNSLFEKITYLRMAASSTFAFDRAMNTEIRPREDAKLGALISFMKRNKRSHWIIFCEFEATADYISRNIEGEIFVVKGSMEVEDRQDAINEFQRTRGSVLIMTPVGSEGLDLQFCDAIINYDLHWNPMRLEQRVGRIDRIGQKKNEIVVINFFVIGSIDERVITVVAKKLMIIKDSPFTPGNLFGRFPRGGEVSGLFDTETLDHELQEGTKLINTIRLTNDLIAEDYKILPLVSKAYCNPERLIEESKETLPWFSKSQKANKWLTSISNNAEFFRSYAN